MNPDGPVPAPAGKSGNLRAMSTSREIVVDLGERSYPIIVGQGLLGGGVDLRSRLAGNAAVIVSNETVSPLYGAALRECLGDADLSMVELPDGEEYKTLATVERVLDRLVSERAARDVTVVALGGGVVGDIAGFAAACYMRGVAFIQVPTTLLAQVDSSVGGKTGVNHSGGKNLIGAFHQPRAVLIDTDTLATLDDRELAAGLAEVIKYGAIVDAAFFAWLEDNLDAVLARDRDALVSAIARCCELKAAVVSEDEQEAGRRAILNFGHTFGHAIERLQGYGDWLHGEAVAAGMLMAARLSGLDDADLGRLSRLLERAGLPLTPPSVGAAAMREAMGLDKKVRGGRLRLVLLRALGDACVTADYDGRALETVLRAAD